MDRLRSLRRLALAGLCLAGLAVLPAANASASSSSCLTAAPPSTPSVAPSGSLSFGIYPGGPVGTVSATAAPVPENPTLRLSALQTLRAGHPFVLHLYEIWTNNPTNDAASAQYLASQVAQYTAYGLQVEITGEYRPADGNPAVDVPGFAAWVRGVVREYAANPLVVSFQITNEANVPGAPGASDGAYAGVQDALIAGVEAAHAEVAAEGHAQKVGFNWAYSTSKAQTAFFSYLGSHGGSAFASAVDWVGVDAYPGVWSSTATTPAQAASVMVNALRVLRQCLLPEAALGSATALHVSENGKPTLGTSTYADQASYLSAEIGAVESFRTQYGVSDYRMFDLRDSNSSDPNIESQYGILRDDYSPKPAFATYQAIIAGAPAGTAVARAASLSGHCVARTSRVPARIARHRHHARAARHGKAHRASKRPAAARCTTTV